MAKVGGVCVCQVVAAGAREFAPSANIECAVASSIELAPSAMAVTIRSWCLHP